MKEDVTTIAAKNSSRLPCILQVKEYGIYSSLVEPPTCQT